MIICLCHRVTESQIERHARGGCMSYEHLQDDLRVGTACGACGECARTTFEAARSGAAQLAGPAIEHPLSLRRPSWRPGRASAATPPGLVPPASAPLPARGPAGYPPAA